MKLFRLAAVAAAGMIGTALVFPAQGRKPGGATRTFSLDSHRFAVEEEATDVLSAIERELRTWGVSDPLPRDPLREALGPEEHLPLRAVAIPGKSMVSLPRGLAAGQAMTLESDTGPVDIVVGRLERPSSRLLAELEADGWSCADAGEDRRLVRRREGRETSLVFLEEKEGRFLFLRRREH